MLYFVFLKVVTGYLSVENKSRKMFTEFAHPILIPEKNPLITPFCKITNHYLLTFAFLQDLVSRLIVLDPSKRLTARQCLEHPWVQVSVWIGRVGNGDSLVLLA